MCICKDSSTYCAIFKTIGLYYFCVLSGLDLGPSLRVKSYRGQAESDEVLTSFSTIEVMEGASLILHCVAIDIKHCEVQWVRENSTLPLTPKNDSVIQWSEIKGEDSGRYRCQSKGTCTHQAFTVDIEVNTIGESFTLPKIYQHIFRFTYNTVHQVSILPYRWIHLGQGLRSFCSVCSGCPDGPSGVSVLQKRV